MCSAIAIGGIMAKGALCVVPCLVGGLCVVPWL